MPYWHDHIAKDILEGKAVIVVAHDYSLRCIIQHLNGLSNDGNLNSNIRGS
jgi:2,3-bisphosphoglycerate-dependent phosphoglycerate mutase